MSIAQSVFDAPARGIVLFAVAAFVAWILCNRDARSRHLIWTFAIICQFALLAFVNIPSRWHVSVPISVPEGSTRVISNAVQHQAPATSIHADEPSHPIQFVLTHLRTPVIWYVAGSMWLLGLALGAVRACWGTFQLWRFAINAQRVIDGSWLSLVQELADTLRIARPMTLLMGYPSAVPITWGFVYPVLLLPNQANSWSDEERYIILMHEMHHVRRLDALTQLVAQLATTVFWFSPFMWIAARCMRHEREHSCDEAILDSGITPSHYAEVLVNIARSLSHNNPSLMLWPQ
jgi:beta-lactamase regulating signal transducer with metallopeptidase domain